MPPKKKKSTPVVVGTVSTRSTRRESIVNIEIFPKNNKSTIKTPVPKKTFTKTNETSNKNEQEKICKPKKTSPEILDILKDWSDDESSQDESMFFKGEDSISLISEQESSLNSGVMHADQQSLIDILEGNQSELSHAEIDSIKETSADSQEVMPESNNIVQIKEIITENAVVFINSPQIEESEIIEEFVVDDNSIIIETLEQSRFTKDYLVKNDKPVKVDPIIKNKNFTKDRDTSIKKKKSVDSNKKLKLVLPCEADEEKQSVTSEDTTSQSMDTIQDEDILVGNNIHIYDNSNTNFEVIEQQVVFDGSEPIDSEIQIQKGDLLENNFKFEEADNKNKIPKNFNDQFTIKNKSDKNYEIPGVSTITVESSQELSNKHSSNISLTATQKCFNKNIEFTREASNIIQKGKENQIESVMGQSLLGVDEKEIKKCISASVNDLNEIVQDKKLESNTDVSQYLSLNMASMRNEESNHDTQSEEKTLCQKMNESMQISKESCVIRNFDLTSDKLQEGIQKMNIEEESEHLNLKQKTILSSESNETKSLSQDIINHDKKNKQDETYLSLFPEKEKTIVSSIEPNSLVSKVEKCLIEPDTEKPPSKTPMLELDIKRRRSLRKKMMCDEQKSSEKARPKDIEDLQEIVDTSKDFISEISIYDKTPKCKKTQKKGVELHKTFTETSAQSRKLYNPELNQKKDDKTKNLKEYSKKIEKPILDVTKMDVDSESSEAKTSETEGDSTSNESSQSSKLAILHRPKGKGLFKPTDLDSKGSSVEVHSEFSSLKSNKDLSSDDINLNRNLKEIKFRNKKSLKKSLDLEMDINFEDIQSDIKARYDNIDATIDDVLRKYTLSDSGTSDDCKSPISTKSNKEFKKKKDFKSKKDEKAENSEEVRRSDRIKTILPVKKKSHGLVRSKSEPSLLVEAENSDTNSVHSEIDKPLLDSPQVGKKNKTKSKSKSSENLQISDSVSLHSENSPQLPKSIDVKADKSGQEEIEARLKTFAHLKENQYKTDRQICKEAREMVCDCYLAEEDIKKDEYGCGEDCLNRLLMIECGYLCQIGDRCTNKRFQRGQVAPVEVFKTEKKGLGLVAAANIPYGEFILEYIGEVLDPDEFNKRAEDYSKDKNIHFYFMSLRADAIIDATMKGNISRFINHSCDPNAETQKWTVNGELRIGFFSTRTILAGEEITFDYKYQRYGKEAQKCFCGATTCRGWIGEQPEESEDEDEEEEEEKVEHEETRKAEVSIPVILGTAEKINEKFVQEPTDKAMVIEATVDTIEEGKVLAEAVLTPEIELTSKKLVKKKPRKELLYEDFDQLNEDIEMLVTTGLKNQAHTLKLSRLMVRSKDSEQRKKLLRILRRGELPCRRLFLDYHGLRLMHGYMIDAQQLTNSDKKSTSTQLERFQTKLELLQTLAVLPIQNKTMLIESKVLPAVKKWAKNEDLIEDVDVKDDKKSSIDKTQQKDNVDPSVDEKIDEIKFLASKLLEEWLNLKESFRIPKKQRIEQMKEHEKEANRKFMENSYAKEKDSSRKNDQRYRTWSRYKSERETNKKGPRPEDKDRPSAEFLKISKHERRKLFALQMELKEEERRLKQREMWRQHEMNCMMIGADPRFTAPFDPNKGFQYIWNPSIGQWQALPVPSSQSQGSYNSPAPTQGVSSFNIPPTHKSNMLGSYSSSILNVSGMSGSTPQYAGMQTNIPPMVPGLSSSVSTITNTVPGIASSIPGLAGLVPGMPGSLHGITAPVQGINQPPLPALPIYQEVKQEEDPSKVKFAGPIPPPVKLPPKWKCAKDKYGRPYYYHIKIRKSQWEPPPLPEPVIEFSESSSSETSSLSSSDTSSESDTDDEIDDTKLLMEVRKQMESTSKLALKTAIPQHVKKEEKDSVTPSPEVKVESDNEDEPAEELKGAIESLEPLSSIDIRLKEQFNLDSSDPPKKRRRIGLCQEIIISPRTEEDRQQFKEDLKRYKATKEKLKRQKEQMLHQAKKKLKTGSGSDDTKRSKDRRGTKSTAKLRMKQMNEWNDEHAKKIKEVFRSTMATTVVGVLNAYRKPDCKESRITNTEDFKHLARKLTHFVMLKEMKHIATIDELICTDNVKAKAREYIKKYMSKFGEVYQKRQDEPDFKD